MLKLSQSISRNQRALIDGDIIAYRAAAVADKESWGISSLSLLYANVDSMMEAISHYVDQGETIVCLSSSTNFRKVLYSDYKANRKTAKPKLLSHAISYLHKEYGGSSIKGYEADDMIAMLMTNGDVCVSLDKDMMQLRGTHFNFVKNRFTTVSNKEAINNFIYQMIVGDTTDNVKGLVGRGKVFADAFISNNNAVSELVCLHNSYTLLLSLYIEAGKYNSKEEAIESFLKSLNCLRLQTTNNILIAHYDEEKGIYFKEMEIV